MIRPAGEFAKKRDGVITGEKLSLGLVFCEEWFALLSQHRIDVMTPNS